MDSDNKVFMAWNRYFIIYSDYGSYNILINKISKYLLKNLSKKLGAIQEYQKHLLINYSIKKILKEKPYIKLLQYSIFDEWQGEKQDVVRALNVFNNDYFSSNEMIKIVKNLKNILKEDGNLIVGHNRSNEYFTVYKLQNNKFKEVFTSGITVDIHTHLIS